MEKGHILLLNGVSSAGKTTLTKVLQQKLTIPYYHICCDDFMNMSPPQMLRDDFSSQLLVTQSIMHETIRLFSDKGHHVIVDDVILDLPDIPDANDWLHDYVVRFGQYPVMFVRVECPVEELERRERHRGDRSLGQAKWQLAHMNGGFPYDLVVNTYEQTLEDCADTIIAIRRAGQKLML